METTLGVGEIGQRTCSNPRAVHRDRRRSRSSLPGPLPPAGATTGRRGGARAPRTPGPPSGVGLASGGTGAQEQADPADSSACESGVISYVFIDNNSVFDTEEIRHGERFRWAYELANTLHMRTTADFIRDELLFVEGDCYDPFLLEESERLVRLQGHIARVDIFGLRQPDGSWHVVVDTKDEWTTKVNVKVGFDEGLQLRRADITEENLLGEGYTVGAFYRERDERQDAGGLLEVPQLFGLRMEGRLRGGTTRIGDFFEQELFHPFVGEVGRLAFRELYLNRDDLFPFSVPDAEPYTHVLLPFEEERVEVTLAGRLGPPGNLTILGLGFSNETLSFPRFPTGVEVAIENDFGDREPAPDDLAHQVEAQTLHSAATRVNLLFGQRNIRFVQRRGLDALRGVQDVPVGTELALTVGRSVAALSSGDDQPDDLYARGRLYGAIASEHATAVVRTGVEGRQVFSGGHTGDGWRDMLVEGDLLAYLQPAGSDGHTLVGRASAAGGWNMSLPYQLTLGGAEALRGYRDEDFPGGQRLILTLEDRFYVGWPFPDMFDLGFTLFAETGAVWAGDVPFGTDSGWQGTAGGGLRIGFPAGTRGVVRVDAAWPLKAGMKAEDVILRISTGDLVGLAGGLIDRQLERSRRVTVGPDLLSPLR